MFCVLHYVIAFCFIFTLQIRNLISSLVENLCNALRINKGTSTKMQSFLLIKDFLNYQVMLFYSRPYEICVAHRLYSYNTAKTNIMVVDRLDLC